MASPKQLKLLTLLLFLIVPFSTVAKSTSYLSIIEGEKRYTSIAQHLYYLEDKTNQLDIQSVIHDETLAWQPTNTDYPSYGITQSTYWFQLRLHNVSNSQQDLYLHVNFPTFDQLNVFYQRADSLQSFPTTGESYPFETRPVEYPSFLFPIKLGASEKITIWVKADSQGAMQLPFELWHQHSFYQGQVPHLLFYASLLSIFLLMAIYNGFLYLPTRDLSYLSYSLFCLVTFGFYSSQNGFSFQFIWPDSPVWQSRSTLLFAGLANSTLCLFTLHFLDLRRYQNQYRLIAMFAIVTGLLSVFMLFIPVKFALTIQSISILVVASSVFSIGIILLRRKHKAARFFVVAWFAFCLSALYTAAGKLDLVNATYWTDHGIGIGITASIVLLSFALADRISLLQQAREDAQRESMEYLKKFKSIFESVVEGIFVLSRHGEWLSANPALLKLLGYSTIDDLARDYAPESGEKANSDEYKMFLKTMLSQQELYDYKIQLKNRFGNKIWVSINARRVTSDSEPPVFEGTMLDITARHRHEQQLKYLAQHDSLTDLYNRRAFEIALKETLRNSRQKSFALLYLDLDQFKLINDTCGHGAGDELLRQLAKSLQRESSDNELVARLGGDEFGILVKNSDETCAVNIAERYLNVISNFRFRVDNMDLSVGVSIGVIVVGDEFISPEMVLSRADAACFLAKDLGRNRVHVYRQSDEEIRQQQTEMEWISTIKRSIEHDNLKLYFHHIKSSSVNNAGYRYEVLLRLDLDGELISPAAFLPAAERYGLSVPVDRWVVDSYFRWLSKNPHHSNGLESASINLSGHSICDEKFDRFLTRRFERYGINPKKICFEITETMVMTRLDQTLKFIEKYKAKGCQFAIDDFGTGFSSYAYLKQLPVDYLKIDGVFIKDIDTDPVDFALAKSIKEVAQAVGLKTVAEFVSRQGIVEKLNEIGIDYHQGYYYHTPELLSENIELDSKSKIASQES